MSALDIGDLPIGPLQTFHDRGLFSCGQPILDAYLHRQIGQDARRRLAAPFVAADNAARVLGFYTLAAAEIRLSALPADLTRRLPHYPAVPAILLGRLAVDRTMQGRGLGRHLLADAMRRAIGSGIGAYALVVDPLDPRAGAFYQREGFLPLGDAGGRLYRRLAEVAEAFGGGSSTPRRG